MEVKEKITLDRLTKDSVSVLRQKFIELDGAEIQVGTNIRNAYTNDDIDREVMAKRLPREYFNAVLSVWND